MRGKIKCCTENEFFLLLCVFSSFLPVWPVLEILLLDADSRDDEEEDRWLSLTFHTKCKRVLLVVASSKRL